ncbi:hypothetical protein ACFQRL_12455 [Microbacterium fluvii]|uniref:Lipoprotein n=1 Tax=Microbacterium fluvii TaxID=415215 RepID=A0ABW2HEQ8_9MICO|nr:hypothetical protein [Microbacterium fluvii]MCU4673408.1 hypothetical protein [Microbacterium fluvii]
MPATRIDLRRPCALLFAILAVGVCTACSTTEGDPATWELRSAVTSASTSLTIGASRLECASGVTGELLEPVIAYEPDRIVIRVDAAPNGDQAADCQGNDVVDVDVVLTESVGDRDLVDGACAQDRAATGTVFCDTAVRWSP